VDVSGRTVDVHAHRLRAKLGTSIVLTSRQIGYRINPDRTVTVVDAAAA
jgi:DNA-binding response OmpR family regulator